MENKWRSDRRFVGGEVKFCARSVLAVSKTAAENLNHTNTKEKVA
jgi:hypothetical protein